MFATGINVPGWESIFQMAWMIGGFSATVALGFSTFLILSHFMNASRQQITQHWMKAIIGWVFGVLGVAAPLVVDLPQDSMLGFKPGTVILMLLASGVLMMVSITLTTTRRNSKSQAQH